MSFRGQQIWQRLVAGLVRASGAAGSAVYFSWLSGNFFAPKLNFDVGDDTDAWIGSLGLDLQMQSGVKGVGERPARLALNSTFGAPSPRTTIALDAEIIDVATGFFRLTELAADPPAPGLDQVIVYALDNGAGKTQLRARFNTGAIQVISAQP